MAFFQVESPDLSGLALGGATLRLLEAYGFSSDEKLLLVRATYTDDGDIGSGLHYGFFLYDIASQSYIANINALLAGAGDARDYDISNAVIAGTADNWSVVAQVETKGIAGSHLAMLNADGVQVGNVIDALTGQPLSVEVEQFILSDDGRFLAVQTSSEQLASDLDPDTNDSSDIYLMDLVSESITRVSSIGGAELNDPTYLHDVVVNDGQVQVSLTTDAAMVSPTRVDINSTDLNGPLGSRTDAYVWQSSYDDSGLIGSPTVEIVSLSADGRASGYVDADYGVQLTAAGVFFSSASDTILETDANASTDAFVFNSDGSISRVETARFGEQNSGGQFLGASQDGNFVAMLTSSSEFGGQDGVSQIVLIDRSDNSYEVVSNNGKIANNVAINGEVSASGSVVAFTSLADNLVAEPLESISGSLFISQQSTPLSGQVYHWNNHALMSDVDVTVESLVGDLPASLVTSTTTDSSGAYELSAAPVDNRYLSMSRDVTSADTSKIVTSADALAALKIAVGINPYADPDGSGPLSAVDVSPYQFVAADVNGDGRVTSADALTILKIAVGLTVDTPSEWVFVNERQDFFDETTGQYLTTRSSITAEEQIPVETANYDANFVAVLTGDVNGSWAAPAESSVLAKSYFAELQDAGVGPLGQWMFIA